MKRFALSVVLLLSFTGCFNLGESDEALLLEIRKDLVESTRPTLVEALKHARKTDGMLDELRTERVNTVDQMIDSIDRVYPHKDKDGNVSPYVPRELPWANKEEGE